MKRIFSKQIYNGYHMISLSDEPNTVLLFGKKGEGRDEQGNIVGEVLEPDKVCQASYMERRLRPWDPWIHVPSVCQKCNWVYRTPGSEYSCLLLDRDKRITPHALVDRV